MNVRTRSLLFAVLIAAFTLVAAPAVADDDAGAEADAAAGSTTGLQAGSHTLSFGFPGGGAGWGAPGMGADIDDFFNVTGFGSIAYFYGLSDSVQIGPVGGFSFDGDNFWLSLAPSLKYFLITDQQVNPYLYASVGFLVGPSVIVPGASGGLGVEFFPVEQLSIGGRIGLTISIPNDEDEFDDFGFWTGTSGLDVNFYF